jgi:hypothetical protein
MLKAFESEPGVFMRSGMIVIAVCAIASWAAPALAQVTADAGPAAAQATPLAEPAKEDPIVCKQLKADTGSRIGGRRICEKSSVWEQQARDARREIDNSQARSHMFEMTPR